MAIEDEVQPSEADPLIGRVLDKYRVVEHIARGGMGRVYRAIQENLGREVALKVLDARDGGDPDFERRFAMEAAVCSRLTHPNTVRIFDFGNAGGGLVWIAMELLRGRSLQEAVAAEAPMDPLRVVRLMKQVCGSLAEAHDHHVVHRDLKPSNILLTSHGGEEYPKVVDFGLVKPLDLDIEVTRSGMLLGSPMYMAPEQITGGSIDARTDLYALGAMLYVMLTGEPPFGRGVAISLMMSHVNDPIPAFVERNPSVAVPASLEWVVRTCLSKSPDERFASARELKRALNACELELEGELAGPLVLALDHGQVVLPAGIEEPSATGLQRGLLPLPASPTQPTLAADLRPALQRHPTARRAVLAVVVAGALMVMALIGSWRDQEGGLEPTLGVSPQEAPLLLLEVILHTEPPGAHVERDGVFLGDAPVRLAIPEGSRWALRVEREGFQTRELVLDGTQPTVRVTLDPLESELVAPAARPAPSVEHAPAPTVAPTGAFRRPKPRPPVVTSEPTPPTPQPEPEGEIRDPWSP